MAATKEICQTSWNRPKEVLYCGNRTAICFNESAICKNVWKKKQAYLAKLKEAGMLLNRRNELMFYVIEMRVISHLGMSVGRG